jgi:hypothetical protein
MDQHPILKGVGIAIAIIIPVGIRLGLFRYIFEKDHRSHGASGGLSRPCVKCILPSPFIASLWVRQSGGGSLDRGFGDESLGVL